MIATVGELRNALQGLDDDMVIIAIHKDLEYWIFDVRIAPDSNYPDWIEIDLRSVGRELI